MAGICVSRRRHYLTGIDWIVQAFDYMNKRATGAGSMFQIVLELDAMPAEDELRDALDHFLRKFPAIHGRAKRGYHLAPYWKMPSRQQKAASPLEIYHLDHDAEVSSLLEMRVNTAFANKREHLAFHLICAGEKSYAAVKFDHCLFDAHGAEAFLNMFQQDWERMGACTWESLPPHPAHLSRWRSKFEAGQRVNRAFLRLAENVPPRVLPGVPASNSQGFSFRNLSFSEQQSREILGRANDEAGYLMAMPYTMAITVQILHRVFSNRSVNSGDYIIPVTMDNRRPSEVKQAVFFNHVSFLLFRIQAREVDQFSVLLQSIKQQMYDQAKAGLARDIWEASFLMRIVPLPILNHLMRIYFKGEIASFCFSFLGETEHVVTHFMGKEILRSYHMTRVPISPGIGVFFHQSRGRLNAYLSYAQGLLSEDEVNTIMDTLRSRLGG
jgi:hypothetical protein